MKSLIITTEETKDTIDGLIYHFTRSNIDYSLFIKEDCVDVWKINRQRGLRSNDRFWNGFNNQNKEMPAFLRTVLKLISANHQINDFVA